jgi:hypothetical protein
MRFCSYGREETGSSYRLLWTAALMLAYVCSPASAFETSTFGGTEIDTRGQGFSYLAVDGTQKINNAVAISVRIMPNYLVYKYYSGDTLIKATSPGLYAVTGLKLFVGKATFTLLGGIETRDTNLTPADRNADVRGHTTAGLIQGGIDVWITKKTSVNLFGSYSGTSNFSYERGSIKQQVTNLDFKKPYTFYAGVEQFVGRNTDFRQEGVGALLEMAYTPYNVSIGVRGGYKHDSTFGDGSYWGLQVYKGF